MPDQHGSKTDRYEPDRFIVTTERIEAYLDAAAQKGMKKTTLVAYRRDLLRLQGLLPEDNALKKGDLEKVAQQLLEQGYSQTTVNGFLSVADAFLQFNDRRDLQLGKRFDYRTADQPELTRGEYLQLLSAAKS